MVKAFFFNLSFPVLDQNLQLQFAQNSSEAMHFHKISRYFTRIYHIGYFTRLLFFVIKVVIQLT